MGPSSTDFRLKVVCASERGEGSQRQLARVFGVSLGFIQGLLQRYRRTGSVQPQPHGEFVKLVGAAGRESKI